MPTPSWSSAAALHGRAVGTSELGEDVPATADDAQSAAWILRHGTRGAKFKLRSQTTWNPPRPSSRPRTSPPAGRKSPLRARSVQVGALRTHRSPATTRPRSRHRDSATPSVMTGLAECPFDGAADDLGAVGGSQGDAGADARWTGRRGRGREVGRSRREGQGEHGGRMDVGHGGGCHSRAGAAERGIGVRAARPPRDVAATDGAERGGELPVRCRCVVSSVATRRCRATRRVRCRW